MGKIAREFSFPAEIAAMVTKAACFQAITLGAATAATRGNQQDLYLYKAPPPDITGIVQQTVQIVAFDFG